MDYCTHRTADVSNSSPGYCGSATRPFDADPASPFLRYLAEDRLAMAARGWPGVAANYRRSRRYAAIWSADENHPDIALACSIRLYLRLFGVMPNRDDRELARLARNAVTFAPTVHTPEMARIVDAIAEHPGRRCAAPLTGD